MTSLGRRRIRAAAVTLVSAVVGSLLMLGVGALPAAATVGDVDGGASITRQMVVERALSWVDESVPYSQSTYWPASAPMTGTGHSYRQDCSGFLSMAWDLTTSAVTGDFVSSSSAYDTQLSSWNLLEPGDLLGVSGHVVLFLGWSSNDDGQHRYFDMVSEATSGTNASVQTSQDREGYWSSYLPFRDKNIVDDAPQTVSGGGARLDQLSLDASGHVQHRWTTDGSSWSSQDLTATYSFVPFRTALTAASTGPGTLDVFGLTTDGRLADLGLTSAGQLDAVVPVDHDGRHRARGPLVRRASSTSSAASTPPTPPARWWSATSPGAPGRAGPPFPAAPPSSTTRR